MANNGNVTEVTLVSAPSPLFTGGDTSTLSMALAKNIKLHELRQAGREYELDVRAMEETIEIYFETCERNAKTPTPAGLANALGLNHKKLLNVLKEDSEKGMVVQDAMEVIHAVYQEAVVNGIMPVKTYTFMAKNYWGMTDKEIIEVKTGENNDVRLVEVDARLNQLRLLSETRTETNEDGVKIEENVEVE